jgi:hypothetical protein
MSPSDFKGQRLNRNEARKLISRLMIEGKVRFLNHAFDRMKERNVSIQDAINVLESPDSKILQEGEFERGSWRYRLCTNRLVLAVGFTSDGSEIIVLTVMRRDR